jgi:DNA-binding response OmpR family regulator
MLDAAGFDVEQASNGVAALRMADTTQPQIVLIRHNLPEIGAPDVLDTLKQDSRTRHCAVLEIRERRDIASGLEADGGLSLPCHPIELLAAVMDALEARHPSRRSVARPQTEPAAPMRSVSASICGLVPLVGSGAA